MLQYGTDQERQEAVQEYINSQDSEQKKIFLPENISGEKISYYKSASKIGKYIPFFESISLFSLQKYWIEVVAVLGQPMCMYNVFMLSSFHSFFIYFATLFRILYNRKLYVKIYNFNYSWL